MHRLNVSEDVLSGIRARRQDGEETADQVLRRLLDLPDAPGTPEPGRETGGPGFRPGFRDATYGIHFPEGFEISRTYKGRPLAARVAGGRWLLDADGRLYDSLNQLSQAVIDGNENAWMFWFYQDPGGGRRRIAELRDPAMVQKRPRRNRHRGQRGKREDVMPAALVGAKAAGKPGAIPAAAAAPAPRPLSGPEPVSPSPPPPGEPASGGMAWQPAAKPGQE